MRILLVKMSSMGDIFHTFPAITDLKQQHPDIEIDWVVEDSFKEIVSWHPAINTVIPINLRRWTKEFSGQHWQEFKYFRKNLIGGNYDLIVDAQGLLKSAVVTKLSKTKIVHGFHKTSAREPFASFFYSHTHIVDKNLHAVARTRELFATIFNYSVPNELNFGIQQNFSHVKKNPQKLIFIIGTSWISKLWSTPHWQRLTALAIEEGFTVEIMWGSPREQTIADSIIATNPKATRPHQRMTITAIAEKLVEAAGVVGLDTGFSHLAGALETPTIALYGATSPIKVGLIGAHTANLQTEQELTCMPCHKRHCKWLPENSNETAPCMNGIQPHLVWQELTARLKK